MLNKYGYEYVRDCVSGLTDLSMKQWREMYEDRTKQSLRDLVEVSDDTELNNNPLLSPSVLHLQETDLHLVTSWVKDEFGKELDTKTFVYEDKSNRLWHPIQNVRKNYKKTIFSEAGMKYQYDIQCCAPTLIHQYAQRCDMDLYLFSLRKYLNNRKLVRHQIAVESDIPESDIKIIINALFSGARLACNTDNAIYKILNYDTAKMEFLKQMPYIVSLREDIKICWEYIKPTMSRRTIIDKRSGKERYLPITSKQKWGIYFDLERQILNSMNEYLSETGNQCFLEHDGWTCVREIDEIDLVEHVLQTTGYKIKIEGEMI
jgi:hypothetical protein